MDPHSSARKYLPSIDGLRAVAVLAVVIFHFFPLSLSGGYTGVDVFFVISGYLVTGIILSDLRQNGLSLFNFYKRRVLRLFPALLAMLITTTFFAGITMLSAEFKNFGLHVFSGAFFFSNITLFKESGYFDTSSDFKPLLHLWSLSLEEQFYLFWPFFLITGTKLKNVLGKYAVEILILIFCAFSLFGSVFYTAGHPSMAFYTLPFRLWELGLGGGLAALQSRGWINEQKFKGLFNFLGICGLLLLLISFYFLSGKTIFPGYAALAPTLGTLLILISREDSSGLKKFLKLPFFVYIGKISYPLYLWHWPIFSFSYIYFGGVSPVYVKVLLIFCSFVFSILTYELIEKRIFKRKTLNAFWVLFATNLFVGGLGFAIFYREGMPERFPAFEELNSSKADFRKSIKGERVSVFCDKFDPGDIDMCLLQKADAPPTMALIGDSHANQWYPGITEAYPDENLLLLAKAGTSPLMGVKSKRISETQLDREIKFVIETESIRTIFISAFWSNYFEEKGTFVGGSLYKNTIYSPELRSDDQAYVFITQLEKTLKMLKNTNKRIVFFYDTPSLDFEIEPCIFKPFMRERKICQYSMEGEIIKQRGYRDAIKSILLKYDIAAFDPLPILCDQAMCDVIVEGKSLFTDPHHLSAWGSKKVIHSYKRGFESP